jgi:hypothetical protein
MQTTTSRFFFGVNEIAAIASGYDRKNGLRRSFCVTGYCDNGEADSKRRFQWKQARILFVSPINGRLTAIEHDLGVTGIVGEMLIRKNIEPKIYDEECYGTLYDPPIEATIIVDDDTLDRLWETSKGTIETRKVLSFNTTLASPLFPKRAFGTLLADDFDITEDRRYGIVSFDLGPKVVRLLRKVDARPEPLARYLPDAAYLSLRVVEVKADIPSGTLGRARVMMLGSVLRPAEHHDALVTIEVGEFGRDRLTDEYPAEAHPGTFGFSKGGVDITLYFTEREIAETVPLLIASAPFLISLSLGVTKDDLVQADGSVQGHVSSYEIALTSRSTES